MKKVQVKKMAANKIRNGYPILMKEDFLQEPHMNNEDVLFVDDKNKFLARGYLSKQNKGIGFIISKNEELSDNFLEEKFQTAKNLRKKLFTDEKTTAFRVFNAEGDGLPGLTVDLYEDIAQFSFYNEKIYLDRKAIVEAFRIVYPEISSGFAKNRFKERVDLELPESEFLYGDENDDKRIVLENGIKYATYMNEGLMTGIFLDQRLVRARLASGIVKGKTVLNLFSYTGAFSVAASIGGAKETTSVDLAKRAIDKTKEQFEINGIDSNTQKIYIMDVFNYFKYALKKGLKYDCIVLDPPSFARNKKKVFRVAKNYGELVRDSLPILSKNGLLVASANTANISTKDFKEMIERELANAGVRYEFTSEYHLPDDFHVTKKYPEGNYLKVFFINIHQ
jgi:23S rRNA (cytosine1962-C5)-methyltransferase